MTDRCFVCGARMWDATDRSLLFPSGRSRAFRLACGSCGVLADDPAEGAESRSHLRSRLAGARFVSDEAASYGLDIHTLRAAASRFGQAVELADAVQEAALRAPHGEIAATARLFPLDPGRDPRVSLGLLCRPDDLDAILPALPAHAGWTDDVVVMVDAKTAPFHDAAGVRVVAHPLRGDFAEQRNALQALGRRPWMLQLDADEWVAPATTALLAALTRMADRDGTVSIGLPRRNFVDGVPSDVFPDVQYRLNRRDVRYAGRVHERPDRPWQNSMIALHGTIDHRLDRAHVVSRSRRYEAMEPGRGRLEEAEALLAPYRD